MFLKHGVYTCSIVVNLFLLYLMYYNIFPSLYLKVHFNVFFKWVGPWTLSSIEIKKRSSEEFRQGFTGTHSIAPGSENKKQMPLLTLFKWSEGKGGLVSRAGRWLRCSVHPLGWCCVQRSCTVPKVLLEAPQKWQLVCGLFVTLFIITMHAVIFSPL